MKSSVLRNNDIFAVRCYDEDDQSNYKVKVISDKQKCTSADDCVKYKFKMKNTNVILGSSMSGKTTIFLHLYKTHLQHKFKIQNTYIISSTVDFNNSMQPIVRKMLEYDKRNDLEDDESLYYNNIYNDWDDSVRSDFEKLYRDNMAKSSSDRVKTLLIFDDITNTIPELKSAMRKRSENNKFFDRLCTQGRHNQFFTWYILHEYYNNIIHKNATLYFLCNSPQIEKVMSNTLRSVSDRDSRDIWNYTLKHNRFPFVVVDVLGKNDNFDNPSIYSMLDKAMLVAPKAIHVKALKRNHFIDNIKNYVD